MGQHGRSDLGDEETKRKITDLTENQPRVEFIVLVHDVVLQIDTIKYEDMCGFVTLLSAIEVV